MSRYYEVEIISVRELAHNVRRVDVRRTDGAAFAIRAGQFLMMHFERDGKKLNRSYSLASKVPVEADLHVLELCIALVTDGIGSNIVRGWKIGDRFTASGPHGRFILRPGETQDLVLVGTGTGIAPYRSMVPQLELALDAGRRVDLIYGARAADDFLYDDEWKHLVAQHINFEYWRCASRVTDPDAWTAAGGLAGRVQRAVERLTYDAENTLFYLCGNETMVRDVTEDLLARGVPRKAVRTEAYVSPMVQ